MKYVNLKFIALLAAAIVVCSCSKLTMKPKHSTMPPGYHLACNANHQFAVARDNSDQYIGDYRGDLPFKSKQDAIERAWDQYEFENRNPSADWRGAKERGFSNCDDNSTPSPTPEPKPSIEVKG